MRTVPKYQPCSSFRLTLRLGLMLCLSLMPLSGCSSIQLKDKSAPSFLVPEQWETAAAAPPPPLEADWWLGFHSPTLVTLVNQALRGNPDLAVTLERVIQAELQLRNSGASLFPSLNLSGNSAYRRNHSDGHSSTSESSGVSLGASYEVDVFGRIAAEVRSARASFEATRYDYEAVRLSLLAGVATAYFQQIAAAERLLIARENLLIAERVLAIVDSRLRFGSASRLDYDRQLSTVLSQRATIFTLEEQTRQLRSALALLIGQVPQGFVLSPEPIGSLQIPVVIPYLPSELLLRRPDLARAEAQLVAAEANISVARAALFPTIQLTGSLGIASNALLSLTDPTTSASLAASLAQTLFDGGRRRNQVAAARSQQRETVENYRKAILTSLKEVEDALDRVNVSAIQTQIQDDIVALEHSNLTRSELRYREGADELLNLLDTQRNLFQAQDQQVQLQLARLNASLDLYKALGGGWIKP